MSDRTYYVMCEDKCLFESMTKEQIYAAIAEATGNTPTGVDAAFITKIKEQRANKELKFWVGTQAQYNAIATPAADTLYLITDPQFEAEIEARVAALEEDVEALEDLTPVDVSDTITLTPSNEGVTIGMKRYVYDPASKIVHFYLMCGVTGTIAAETAITITHTGGYAPYFADYVAYVPITANATLSTAHIHANYIPTGITMQCDDASISSGFVVSGFYLCDNAT